MKFQIGYTLPLLSILYTYFVWTMPRSRIEDFLRNTFYTFYPQNASHFVCYQSENIEKFRHSNVLRNMRFMTCVIKNDIEDEFHYILKCPFFLFRNQRIVNRNGRRKHERSTYVWFTKSYNLRVIASLRADRGTLRLVVMHVVHINTQSNNKI